MVINGHLKVTIETDAGETMTFAGTVLEFDMRHSGFDSSYRPTKTILVVETEKEPKWQKATGDSSNS